MGVVLFVLRNILPDEGLLLEYLNALVECLSLLTYAWVIFGMGLFNIRASDDQLPHASNVLDETPRLAPVLLGWGCGELLYSSQLFPYGVTSSRINTLLQSAIRLGELLGMLAVGTFLWGGAAGRKGVAYWTAATLVLYGVLRCALTWVLARAGEKVT